MAGHESNEGISIVSLAARSDPRARRLRNCRMFPELARRVAQLALERCEVSGTYSRSWVSLGLRRNSPSASSR